MQLPPPTIRIIGPYLSILSEPGADIFYTTDGKEPTPASTQFPTSSQSALLLGVDRCTVRAIAVRRGVISASVEQLYHYEPPPLVFTPLPGKEPTMVGTVIKIVSDHKEIRYTSDGTIPTASSTEYKGGIHLSRPGTIVVTAAMFHGGLPLGDPARATYQVISQALEAPGFAPPGGVHQCPLLVTLIAPNNATELRYTTDGSDPNLRSLLYVEPIAILQPQSVLIKAIAIAPNCHASPVAATMYSVSRADVVQMQRGGFGAAAGPRQRPLAYPVENMVFSHKIEERARENAEEAMAWILAAGEVREKRARQAAELKMKVIALKDRYRELVGTLEETQRRLVIASQQKQDLSERKISHVCTVKHDLERREHELEAERMRLKLRDFALRSQVDEAIVLHRRALEDQRAWHEALNKKRSELEAAFLERKKELSTLDESAVDEAQELERVVAEQRHELELLRCAEEALRPPLLIPPGTLINDGKLLAPGINPENVFLPPPRKPVDIPRVEAIIPVPAGRLRLLTTLQGDGLQMMRQKHHVSACVVPSGAGLGIKVVGHSVGVLRFVTEVAGVLGLPPPTSDPMPPPPSGLQGDDVGSSQHHQQQPQPYYPQGEATPSPSAVGSSPFRTPMGGNDYYY